MSAFSRVRVGVAQRGEDLALPGFHFFGFGVVFVIETLQMQHTMHG